MGSIIPPRFLNIISKNEELHRDVLDIVTTFGPIFEENNLYFFEEYTDHGIKHIKDVLATAEFLIPEESFDYISDKDVAVLVMAVVLHDIGMHTNYATFLALLDGKYDSARVKEIDTKTWAKLWKEYLSDAKCFNSQQKENIWGDCYITIKEPDLTNKDKLDGEDKKLIGEFIRRHHARLAHEIALAGFIGNGNVEFGGDRIVLNDKRLAGIVARSHGMDVRKTFDYLKSFRFKAWKTADGVNAVYLMVLLRIADYLQIDSSRTNIKSLRLKTLNSLLSRKEHQAHLAIDNITYDNDDIESVYVVCNPATSEMYVKLDRLIIDIQNELDRSWAILGEIYGAKSDAKPQMKFRRIESNLKDEDFLKAVDYVAQEVSFKASKELSKLLVAPLYGEDPRYGVRELVQNATDACKERAKQEELDGKTDYEPLVTVSIDTVDENNVFAIEDNGKGMTLDEILNYFLTVGSSLKQSHNWKKAFTAEDGKPTVARNGKFGVGILSAFLLGNEISVTTRSAKDEYTYKFSTEIDSEFVEIKRDQDSTELGTKIEICSNKDLLSMMANRPNPLHVGWNNWYLGAMPIVKYRENGVEVKSEVALFKDDCVRVFSTTDFGYVQWSYASLRFDIETAIVCNDIFVTKNSAYSRFQLGLNRNSNTIVKMPSFIVEDPYGYFPLRLDRNDVDCKALPFEEKLYEEVSKDFIAQLLTLNNVKESFNRLSIQPHNPMLLYAREGYCLVEKRILERLEEEEYELLKVDIDRNPYVESLGVLSRLCDTPKRLVIGQEITNEFLTFYYTTIGTRFICSNDLLERYKSQNAAPSLVKYAEVWSNDKYSVYTRGEYSERSTLLSTSACIAKIETLIDAVPSIQEIPFSDIEQILNRKQSNNEGYCADPILSDLLKKYLGDNIIIPYDMDERKKLYPLAFDELAYYMKFYEKEKD